MWERVKSLLGRLDKIPGYRTMGGYLSGYLIYLSADQVKKILGTGARRP
ncbi:MAG TPA: hypothetical protein VI094_06070 [Propionibacteriaceae bacterium]